MKTLMRQALREWERTLLWASVAALSLVVVFLLSRLAAEKAPSQARLLPVHSPQSCLNEETAFDFLQPPPVPGTSARNPFAFSLRLPKPKVVTPPADPPVKDGAKTAAGDDSVPAGPGQAEGGGGNVTPPPPPPPPPPPKRSASILYRGLYSGGRDATRQFAFVSTREAPGEITGTAVLAPGQKTAGVTVKRVTPAELVVAGPTGVEVSIAVGTQAQIALE